MHAKQYKFTVQDIATVTQQNDQKVYRDIRNGVFDPTKIEDVTSYISAKKALMQLAR